MAQILGSMAPIHISRFHRAFNVACDNKGSNKKAAIWLLLNLMKKLATATLTANLSIKAMLSRYSVEGGLLDTHCQVKGHISETYATDNIMAKNRWLNSSLCDAIEHVCTGISQ